VRTFALAVRHIKLGAVNDRIHTSTYIQASFESLFRLTKPLNTAIMRNFEVL
jgi:hypothetical protein